MAWAPSISLSSWRISLGAVKSLKTRDSCSATDRSMRDALQRLPRAQDRSAREKYPLSSMRSAQAT